MPGIFSSKYALFIDVDETLIQARKGTAEGVQKEICGMSLLYVMQQAAVKQLGMRAEKAEEIIKDIFLTVKWWHWSDFIIALGLNSKKFWDYAYEFECEYLEPVSPDLPKIFSLLKKAGYRMFITSNNPNSGILHKLRIAGLAEIWGSPYFMQYFGPPGLRYMKHDPNFWIETIAQTGLDPSMVVTIGDNWNDDVISPLESGIKRRIYLDRSGSNVPDEADGVWRVLSWADIAMLLLDEDSVDKWSRYSGFHTVSLTVNNDASRRGILVKH